MLIDINKIITNLTGSPDGTANNAGIPAADTNFNPFDVYNAFYSEINDGEESAIDYDTFNKIMLGELETDDELIMGVIQATKLDEDDETVSHDELMYLYEEITTTLSEEEPQGEDLATQLWQNQMEEIAQNYYGKPASQCTQKELDNACALSLLEGILSSAQQGLIAQDNSDGWISELFDGFKTANGIDLTQQTVEEAILKQEEIINTLKETLVNGGDFEAVWEELTGVKYDAEKIAQYQQKATELQFIQMGAGKISNFCLALQSPEIKDNPEKMLDLFVQFYGEEKGKQEFCTMIQSSYNRNPNSFYFSSTNQIKEMSINENNEYVVVYQDGTTGNLGSINYTELDALKGFYTDGYREQKINKYIQEVEATTGLNYEQIVQDYNRLSKEALGEANAVTNILNEYISSQEGFIDGLASASQFGGMALMAIGGIACFVPGGQVIGGLLLSTGNTMALAGTFGDEALEFADTATNNNDFSQDKAHYKDILKETLTDVALFTAGYAIGGVAGEVGEWAAKGAGKWIASEGGQKFVSIVTELGVDGTLSLLSDMIITGEALTLENVGMETISQLLSVVTGIATARLNNPNANTGNTSTNNNGDWEPENYGPTRQNPEGNNWEPEDYSSTGQLPEGWEASGDWEPENYDSTGQLPEDWEASDGWEPEDYDSTGQLPEGWEASDGWENAPNDWYNNYNPAQEISPINCPEDFQIKISEINDPSVANNAYSLMEIARKQGIDLNDSSLSYRKIPNSNDYEISITKSDNDTVTSYTMNSQGEIKILEVNRTNVSWGGSTQDGPITSREISEYTEIITDKTGKPIEIIYAKASDILPGTFESTKYTVSDYPEGYDITAAIKDGSIQGGKKLSSITTNPDGSITYNENFTMNGTTTQRSYSETKDPDGNVISSQYSYQIIDENGNVAMSINREFATNPDGTTTTIINGKTYTSKYNDQNKTIEITQPDGSVKIIDIQNKYREDVSIEEQDAFWEFCKYLPADMLNQLDENIDILKIGKWYESSASNFNASAQLNFEAPSVVYHEMGHLIDNNNVESFSQNPEIVEQYNKEFEIFMAENPEFFTGTVYYFDPSSEGGIKEFIAETIALLTTPGTVAGQRSRIHILQKYFPNTIALIGKQLGY